MNSGMIGQTSRGEAFPHYSTSRDESVFLNELPTIMTRVFRTEHDKLDNKYPCWLDLVDMRLHDHR
jgi:hypothetical protein